MSRNTKEIERLKSDLMDIILSDERPVRVYLYEGNHNVPFHHKLVFSIHRMRYWTIINSLVRMANNSHYVIYVWWFREKPHIPSIGFTPPRSNGVHQGASGMKADKKAVDFIMNHILMGTDELGVWIDTDGSMIVIYIPQYHPQEERKEEHVVGKTSLEFHKINRWMPPVDVMRIVRENFE